jgi:hypothetical protein
LEQLEASWIKTEDFATSATIDYTSTTAGVAGVDDDGDDVNYSDYNYDDDVYDYNGGGDDDFNQYDDNNEDVSEAMESNDCEPPSAEFIHAMSKENVWYRFLKNIETSMGHVQPEYNYWEIDSNSGGSTSSSGCDENIYDDDDDDDDDDVDDDVDDDDHDDHNDYDFYGIQPFRP